MAWLDNFIDNLTRGVGLGFLSGGDSPQSLLRAYQQDASLPTSIDITPRNTDPSTVNYNALANYPTAQDLAPYAGRALARGFDPRALLGLQQQQDQQRATAKLGNALSMRSTTDAGMQQASGMPDVKTIAPLLLDAMNKGVDVSPIFKLMELSQKQDQRVKTSPGDILVDQSNKPVFTNPAKPELRDVAPGATLGQVGANGFNPLYTAPSKPVEPMTELGKAQADLAAGRISQNNYDLILGQRQADLIKAQREPEDTVSTPTMIGYTGPDGEEVQTAASFNKKSNQYVNVATGQPILNPQNLRILGTSTGGARSAGAVSRVLTNAEDATSGIENLSNINAKGSGGLFPNLMTTPLSALSRSVTPQEVQDVQATMAGLGRAMGGLATGGLAVDESVQKSYEGLALQTGDSQLTKMRKLAEMRQQTTNALDVQSVSPILSPAQKQKAKDLSERIKKAVPWTVSDVQALENSGNPSVSMRDLAQQKLGRPQGGVSGKTGNPLVDKYLP